MFRDRENAEQGLKHLAEYLSKLNLQFNQDEAKRPVVEVNTDFARVRKVLDKIQYGILESARNLPHLARQAIKDFGDVFARERVSPENLDELVEINDSLPSLLLVVTQESLIPHPLKEKVRGILGYLVRHHLFCPKKLKNIFYYILRLEPDKEVLRELFNAMEPAHKAYFILSVFARWKIGGEFRGLLEDLVAIALAEPNAFVWGFAVAIASDLAMGTDQAAQLKHLQELLSHEGGLFALNKWAGTVNYNCLTPEEQKPVREIVGSGSPDLTKLLILSGFSSPPSRYIDGLFVRNILQNSGPLLLPAVSMLLAASTDATELFYDLIDFGLRHLAFKSLFISLVKNQLFESRTSLGLAEMDNLNALYNKIPDQELAKAMLSARSRVTEYEISSNTEFAKLHAQIGRYNECFLFERTDSDPPYSYLELIPENKLREHLHCDLDTAKEIIADFSANCVLAPSNFAYSSETGEIRLEFKNSGQYVDLHLKQFSHTPNDIRCALLLAVEAYKKALYFHRKTGKVPPISLDNVLVDQSKKTIAFRTLGKCLCVPHWVGDLAVGDESSDIPKMVSVFLRDLLFETEAEAGKFMGEKNHKGLDAFLCQCIENLGARESAHRYSYFRFAYLVQQFDSAADQPEEQMCMIYLRERLKGALFRFNSEKITWGGICRAVNEHITDHVREVCSSQMLNDAPFRNRLLFQGRGKHTLHTLSRELLNLVLNRQYLLDGGYADGPYCDLVEFLLLYGIVCVEVVSLARLLDDKQALRQFYAKTPRPREVVRVGAAGLDANFAAEDLGALLIDEPKQRRDQAIMGLSLRQLAIQSLLACGVVEVDGLVLKVKKPEGISEDVFHRFVHASLIRVPQIEHSAEELLGSLFLALRQNEQFARPACLPEVYKAVGILAEDFQRFRRNTALMRRYGYCRGKYFPVISCKSWFRRAAVAQEEALPGLALTNSFPTSSAGYASSWDLRGTSIVNLVIPSEGVNSLIVALSRGKFFGYKFRYLYSGRSLLLWDTAVFIASGIALAACTLATGSSAHGALLKGISAVGPWLFGPVCFSLLTKALLYDLGYWMGSHRRIMRAMREMFTSSPPSS